MVFFSSSSRHPVPSRPFYPLFPYAYNIIHPYVYNTPTRAVPVRAEGPYFILYVRAEREFRTATMTTTGGGERGEREKKIKILIIFSNINKRKRKRKEKKRF